MPVDFSRLLQDLSGGLFRRFRLFQKIRDQGVAPFDQLFARPAVVRRSDGVFAKQRKRNR
jgi:hypothetical protein